MILIQVFTFVLFYFLNAAKIVKTTRNSKYFYRKTIELLHTDYLLQTNIIAAGTDHDAEIAGLEDGLHLGINDGKFVVRQGELHVAGLALRNHHTAESLQLRQRLYRRCHFVVNV